MRRGFADRRSPRPTPGPTPPPPRSGPAAGVRSLRVLAAAAATGAVTAALARRALDLLHDLVTGPGTTLRPDVRVEDLVELGAVIGGSVLACWFALGLVVAATCTLVRELGGAWQAGERLVGRAAPLLVRRTLAVSAGAGIALAGPAGAAVATTPPPEDLGWTVATEPSPTSPAGPATPSPTGSAPPSAPPSTPASPPASASPSSVPTTSPAVVTVRPGDTLWAIARAHLPEGATVADVAAAWPHWYAVNTDVVGPDPDLIRPGQRLVPPTVTVADGAGR